MRWLMASLLVGCTADRVLVQVPVEVEPTPAELSTDDGTTVRLTAASLVLADLRFEHPATTTASLWRALSPIPVAQAHPGHDFAGGVGGELVGQWTVDLLGPGSELGVAGLYDGSYATGHLTLPAGGLVILEGTASTGSGERSFRFELEPDHEVTGIPFEVEVVPETPPTRIVLGFDAGHALSFVDWSTPAAGEQLTLDDGVLRNTVDFGVVATPSYTLTLEN